MRQIWIKSILKIRSVSSIIHIVKNQNTSRLTKREILRKCCSSTISRFFVCTEKTESTFLSVPGRSGDRVQSGFPLTAGAVVFLSLLVFSPRTALIALLAAAVSLGFLLLISRYSAQNAPVEAQANRDMTGAILEYARGLAVVKSFGRDIPLEHFDIAFDHVSFGYDDRQVLHDVSFTIPEKTSTAIVGPSSSGKTTLCFAVQRAEDLLRKVERVVFALLVGQARIRSKIFQRQGIFCANGLEGHRTFLSVHGQWSAVYCGVTVPRRARQPCDFPAVGSSFPVR